MSSLLTILYGEVCTPRQIRAVGEKQGAALCRREAIASDRRPPPSIKGLVKFRDYEVISQLHTKVSEPALLEQVVRK